MRAGGVPWGPDAGAGEIAYLTCGTGFGAGLALDGRVRYGSSGHSPELGHVRYRAAGPEIFGKPGCYEGYGSANAIALLAGWTAPERFADSSPEFVVATARAGDPEARAALRENEVLPANAARCRLRAPMAQVQDRSGLAAALDALPPPAS